MAKFNPSAHMIPGPGRLTLVWTGPVMPDDVVHSDPICEETRPGDPLKTIQIGLNMRDVDAAHKDETMRIIEEASFKHCFYKVRWQHTIMAQLSTFATVDQVKKFIDEEMNNLLE